MGFYANKKTKGFYGSQKKTSNVNNLQDTAVSLGYKPQTETISNLDKLFGVLSAAETAPAVYAAMTGGDPVGAYGKSAAQGLTLKGMQDKKTYADVLGLAGVPDGTIRKLFGVGLDVLLDPTTYIGGAIAKGAIKAGKTIGKTGVNVASKLPIVGKSVKPAIEGVEDLFVAGSKLKRSGELGQEYWQDYLNLQRGTRGAEMGLIEDLTGKMKNLEKLGVSRTNLGIEKGITKLPQTQQEAFKPIVDMFSDMAGEESKRGLLKSNLESYVPHILSNEGRDFVLKGKIDLGAISKPLRAKLGAGKQRKLLGTIQEINERTLKEHGIKLFEDDIFKIAATRGINSIRAIHVHDFLKTTGDKFGIDAIDDFPSKLVDGIKYVKPQAPTLAGKMLPEEIAKHIDETYKFLSNDESVNGFLKSYDKLLNIWKGSVTSLFPAFHGRNAIGGLFNNFLAGVKNPTRYAEANRITSGAVGDIVLNGKSYSYETIRNLMRSNGLLNSTGFFDVARKKPEEVLNGAKGLGIIPEKAQDLMKFIENNLRGTLFVDRLAKGDSAIDAAKQVYKFHFDYSPEGLSVFENQVMKRLIPFYTWSRNNIPLQISQAVLQPGKYAAVGKTLRALRGDTTAQNEEYPFLPDYMKKSFPIRTGQDEKGNPNYLYGLGLPIEDLNKSPKNMTLDSLSPLLKFPLEQATGMNFFFNKPISEMDSAPQIVGSMPKPIQDFLDYKETTGTNGKVYRTLDPHKWHFVTSLASRGIFTADKMSDPKMPLLLKGLYFGLGMKPKTVDIETEKYYRTKEEDERINKFLESKGIVKKYETYYVPKIK